MTTNNKDLHVVNFSGSKESFKEDIKKSFIETHFKEQCEDLSVCALYSNYLIMAVQVKCKVKGKAAIPTFFKYIGEITDRMYNNVKLLEEINKILVDNNIEDAVSEDLINDAMVNVSHENHLSDVYEVYQLKWAAKRFLDLYHQLGEDREALLSMIFNADFVDEDFLSYNKFMESYDGSLPIEGISGDWTYKLYQIKNEMSLFFKIAKRGEMPLMFVESPNESAMFQLLGMVAAYNLNYKFNELGDSCFLEAEKMFFKFAYKGIAQEMLKKHPLDASAFWIQGFTIAGLQLGADNFEPFDMSEAEKYMKYIA